MSTTLRVIEPGPLDSVQDLGRAWHGSSGVPVGGAADAISLRVGNRLVGNDDNAAAIEMTLVGGTYAFAGPSLVCLAGADAPGATVERGAASHPLPAWTPRVLAAGSTLRVGPLRGGTRTCLCVSGGVRTEPVLGSRSALASIGPGTLAARDEIPVPHPPPGLRVGPLDPAIRDAIDAEVGRRALRVVPGAQAAMLGDAAARALAGGAFRVGRRSDRSGIRLEGGALSAGEATLEKSEGVVPGSIQVPPSGEPIVLCADGPTVGGYPVIASVIGADLPALGQLTPGDGVSFEWVSLDAAWAALREQQLLLERVPRAVPMPQGER